MKLSMAFLIAIVQQSDISIESLRVLLSNLSLIYTWSDFIFNTDLGCDLDVKYV